jgi:hypothetical protein
MSEHRHRYEPSLLVPGFELCANARYSKCDAPQRQLVAAAAAAAPAPAPTAPIATGYKQTSREAYEKALPRLTDLHERVLDLLWARGPMTDEELFDAYVAKHGSGYRNTVLPARTSLNKAGLVVDTGDRREVRSGRTAIVWAAKR